MVKWYAEITRPFSLLKWLDPTITLRVHGVSVAVECCVVAFAIANIKTI